MKKIIFLTWTDRRGFSATYGKPVAALWKREGTNTDVASAQAYARKAGADYRVYATSAYELFAVAKAEALKAHTK